MLYEKMQKIGRIIGTETEYGHCVWGSQDWSAGCREPSRLLRDYMSKKGSGEYLENGARIYIDSNAHFECATPETYSVYQAALYDKAMEREVARWLKSFNDGGESGFRDRIVFFKNNTDHHGNSQGCHENYLVPAQLWNFLVASRHPASVLFLIFLAVRNILCGSGTINNEMQFLLSQRADFIVKEFDTSSTSTRPMIHRKSESLAGDGFGRLHLILGDSNMSEWSTYLKIGATHLMLKALERTLAEGGRAAMRYHRHFPKLLSDYAGDAVWLMKAVSRDLAFERRYDFGQRSLSVFDIHRIVISYIERTLEGYFLPEEKIVLERWERFLGKIEAKDNDFLGRRLDWAIKKNIMERRLERRGINPNVLLKGNMLMEGELKRLRLADLLYHDISEHGIYNRLAAEGGISRLFDNDNLITAAGALPPATRAAWRGGAVAFFRKHQRANITITPEWTHITCSVSTPKNTEKVVFSNVDPWNSDWGNIKIFLMSM